MCTWQGTEKRGGMNWEVGIDIYTRSCIKQAISRHLLYTRGLSSVLCGDPDGWGGGRVGEEGIHVYIWLCTAETNNIVKQLYTNKLKK